MQHSGRVALVTQGYFTAGGVQTVSRWLRAGLESHGFSVDVHELAASATDATSRRLVNPATWFKKSLRVAADREDVALWGANLVEFEPCRYLPRRQLSSALAKYDIVQVVAGGSALALAASRSGRPVILQVATRVRWERASGSFANGATGLARRAMTGAVSAIEPAALRSAHRVMVENWAMADYVRSVGQSRVTVAPPGVDTDVFVPNPTGWQQDGYILSVCRLGDSRKGLERMVKAYAELSRRVRDCPALVLAGRGDLDPGTQNRISSLGLGDRIEIRPDVPLAELPALYQGASMFWQASFEEGLGVSSIEAQASGLPVVATRTDGAARAIRDGVSGHLVAQGDDHDVASHMAESAVGVFADGRTMSHAAREWAVAQFSESAAFGPYLDAYHEAMGDD